MINRDSYKVCGLMSGTSLDGVDLALVHFFENGGWSFELIKSETIAYDGEWSQTLKAAADLSSDKIKMLDDDLGKYFGQVIRKFVADERVDFISSHGHTVLHQPDKRVTFQAGNGQVIHELTGLPVVNNFRQNDVKMGGQGAPLVPIGDQHLFPAYQYCLNLGGIANVSYLKDNERLAFDIVPCNMLLNYLAEKLGRSYDANGVLASSGKVIDHLLNKWNEFDFYNQSPPKSLGYEWVSTQYFTDLNNDDYSVEDRLATAAEHVAFQISQSLGEGDCLITGGGAFNTYLIDRIKYYSDCKIIIPSDEIINYKEAIVFGFLGVLRVRGENNILASVTGADRDSCSGDMIGF